MAMTSASVVVMLRIRIKRLLPLRLRFIPLTSVIKALRCRHSMAARKPRSSASAAAKLHAPAPLVMITDEKEGAMVHSEGFLKIVNAAKSRVKETTPEEVRRRQQAGESFHFVDVREDNEWQAGHAAGAVHLGKGVIERDIEQTINDHGAEIILYCGGGYRS